MADDIFAPLPGARSALKPAAPKDQWCSIIPVPDDAPPCPPQHRRHGNPSRCWTYRNAAGELLGYVLRFDVGRRQEIRAGDLLRERAHRRARMALQGMVDAAAALWARSAQQLSAPVVVCEARKPPMPRPSCCPVMSPSPRRTAPTAPQKPIGGRSPCRDVTLWPDNDDEGRAYAEDVARLATAVGAASVAIVTQPAHWPEGWDIADPLPRYAAPEMLGELLQSATPWTPPAPDQRRGDFDAAEIARLGALKPLAYDREREAAAKRSDAAQRHSTGSLSSNAVVRRRFAPRQGACVA
jgi:hypothetical protein